MGSEQEARAEIDRLLTAAGWRVQEEMIEDLEAALEQLRAIAADLGAKPGV